MFLVDSHCHLDLLNLATEAELNQVLNRAKEEGVRYMLNVCVQLSTFPSLLKVAEMFPEVGASVGLHPNERDEEVSMSTLMTLARHPKVVAIGETGLDYYRSSGDLNWQRDRFRLHIEAAKKLKLPLIIHTRAAIEDTLAIMKEENASEVGGVMHCFSEDLEAANKAIEMNFYISFSGTLTFKNATTLQQVAKAIPLNRILVETDSPYLTPHPHRGKQNEPGYVRHTAEFLATLREDSLENIARATTQNFFSLFKGAVQPHV